MDSAKRDREGDVATAGGETNKVARLSSGKEPLIFYLHNVNGLKSHRDGLQEAADNHSASVLMVTETFVKGVETNPSLPSGHRDDVSSIRPFKGFSDPMWSCNTKKRAGGVMMVSRIGTERPSYTVYSLSAAAHKEGLTISSPPFKNGESSVLNGGHTVEGRVMFSRYPNFLLGLLYWPNSGILTKAMQKDVTKMENAKKKILFRQEMDTLLIEFALQCKIKKIPLLLLGDINVAASKEDVSHPDDWPGIFSAGFSKPEQLRFEMLLKKGDLVDAWREHHPTPSALDEAYRKGPNYSWRGNGRVNDQYAMRLDYCLCSRDLLPRIKSVTLTGTHDDRGSFLGSDHCPLVVTLHPSDAVPPASLSSSSSSSDAAKA